MVVTSWSEMAASQDFSLDELISSFMSLPLIRTYNEVFESGFNSMHYIVSFRLKGSRSLQLMLGGSSQGP